MDVRSVSTSSSFSSLPSDVGGLPWDAREMVRVARRTVQGWKGLPKESFLLEAISGGMTNHLYKVTSSLAGAAPRDALLRIFGQEASICREKDDAIFRAMAEAGLGPKLYGTFEGGRLEEFLVDSRPLDNAEMVSPIYAKQISKRLAMVHELKIPLASDSPQLLYDIRRLASLVDDSATASMVHTPEYYLAQASKIVKTTASKVTFCHNDLQEGNIMKSFKTDELTLIDFEYGGYNYALFDMANHFAEYAFVYTDVPAGDLGFELHTDAYPTRTRMLDFLGEYTAVLGEGVPEDMVDDVEKFILASHLFWGLWAAALSARGEGYRSYMRTRLSEFERLSERLMA